MVWCVFFPAMVIDFGRTTTMHLLIGRDFYSTSPQFPAQETLTYKYPHLIIFYDDRARTP